MKSLVSAASSIFTLSLTFLASAAPAGLETRDIESRAARTTAPSGCLVVGSSGTYKTLGAALTELGSGTSAACIFMQAGTYNEQVTISYKGALTLYGSTAEYVVLFCRILNIYWSELAPPDMLVTRSLLQVERAEIKQEIWGIARLFKSHLRVLRLTTSILSTHLELETP